MQKKLISIGLDCRPMEPGFKAHYGRGTGRYATELVSNLHGLPQEDFKLRNVHCSDVRLPAWQEKIVSAIPFGRRTLEAHCFLPRVLEQYPADYMHFFNHGDVSPYYKKPYFVTVLDLIPALFPQLYRPKRSNLRFKFARWLENESILRAAGVFAISESTANDLVRLLGYRRSKIVVTPLAVSDIFKPLQGSVGEMMSKKMLMRESLGLSRSESILLYVGGIDPRKNVLFLLRAFAELCARDSKKQFKLIMVGKYDKDNQYPKLLAEIKRLALEQKVDLFGFVSDEDLVRIYQCADVTVFPSLYEGFGLPVLESLASGCPVVAGNNSCMPEVVGDAGILVEDNDLDGWVGALSELLSGEVVSLREKGIARAKLFSWRSTAEKTFEGYRRFCA